jgi:hypothetical protein
LRRYSWQDTTTDSTVTISGTDRLHAPFKAQALAARLPGATFKTNGAQPAANAALASLGAEMKWHNGRPAAGHFESEFSRATAGYVGKGSVRYAR